MKPDRRRVVGGAASLLLVAAAGCRGRQTPSSSKNSATRVVSLSPNTTETLFAVGAGNRVVGRSRFCDYPAEVTKIPSVGGYVDASLEAILALRPDLVVGARGPAGPALTEKLSTLGIATFFPPTESMAEIDAMISELAVRVGAREEGTRVVERLRARRDAVAHAVATEARVRTLLVFSVSPIVAAGPQSFPNEMIALANGDNVVTTGGAYPTLGVERLLAVTPDVVINASMAGATGATGDGIGRDDPGWRELAAVREGRVVAIRDEAVLRPGPRIGDGLATLARAMHPSASVP
jgi:iron complex transport system substrate-binding protein